MSCKAIIAYTLDPSRAPRSSTRLSRLPRFRRTPSTPFRSTMPLGEICGQLCFIIFDGLLQSCATTRAFVAFGLRTSANSTPNPL